MHHKSQAILFSIFQPAVTLGIATSFWLQQSPPFTWHAHTSALLQLSVESGVRQQRGSVCSIAELKPDTVQLVFMYIISSNNKNNLRKEKPHP